MNELIYTWLEKCLPCFLPLILLLIRYHSLGANYKQSIIDLIVDLQFCVTPFLLSVQTVINLYKKRGISDGMEILGVFTLVTSLIILCWNALLYWDLTFVGVQKNEESSSESGKNNKGKTGEDAEDATYNNKKKVARRIIALWVMTLTLSFISDVIIM